MQGGGGEKRKGRVKTEGGAMLGGCRIREGEERGRRSEGGSVGIPLTSPLSSVACVVTGVHVWPHLRCPANVPLLQKYAHKMEEEDVSRKCNFLCVNTIIMDGNI